jgi:hypothetical protein
MRKVIQEPGFWTMIFGVIILAMLLFAGNADCAEPVKVPAVRYMVELEKTASGWGLGVGFADDMNLNNAWQEKKYHHYIQATGKKPIRVLTTDYPPNLMTLIISLQVFDKMGE